MAAKRFLEERPEEKEKAEKLSQQLVVRKPYVVSYGKDACLIGAFLGWGPHIVQDALSSLRDVESGVVDREAVEMMPLDLPPWQGYHPIILRGWQSLPLCWPRSLDISFPGVHYFGKVIHGPI